MSRSMVEQVADAVLYEGYILFPYRPSATKNKRRFTFGRVYPQAYSEAEDGRERCAMQTQVLVEGQGPTVDISVRFLHPMDRQVGRLPEPVAEWDGESLDEAAPEPRDVPELRVGEDLYQTWQEAFEQEVKVPTCSVKDLSGRPREIPFSFPDFREQEPILNEGGQVVGVMTRRRQALDGVIELAAEPVSGGRDDSISRLTVRVVNRTPVPEALLEDRNAIVMRLFASAHTILRVKDGAFLSLTDPPPAHREAAVACENDGTWPVLIGERDGDEDNDQRDSMLSSPIILPDYPEIAPESPGDFFDGTEMDEMLALHIQAMTEEEKREMRSADERGREILERLENLPDEHLQKLHGTIREMRALGSATDEEQNGAPKSITVEGITYRVGDRVRIRSKGGNDVMDIALDGMTAIIQAIEEDFENRVHFALVMEDDPGRDFGMDRQPGHRFFYAPHEVERLPRTEMED